MTTRSTPCSRSRVAVECRRSWKRIVRSPALWRRRRKRRLRLPGSSGLPFGVVKTPVVHPARSGCLALFLLLFLVDLEGVDAFGGEGDAA